MIRVYVLLGGFFGPDGWVTSVGFLGLSKQISLLGPGVVVKNYTWDRYADATNDALSHPGDKIVLVGYSGGGTRALWADHYYGKLKTDLMVLYDPSPRWQMINPSSRVKKCLLYHNNAPMFFGLGGGLCTGPQVLTRVISENHVGVQTDRELHALTLEAIRELTT